MKYNHLFVLTKNWMIIVPKQEYNRIMYFVQKAPSSDAVSKFFIDLIPRRLPDSWLLQARWQQQQEKVWIKIHLWPFPRYSSSLFILWEWKFEYVCHHITFMSENSYFLKVKPNEGCSTIKQKKQSSEYTVPVLAASQMNYVLNPKSLLKHITCR